MWPVAVKMSGFPVAIAGNKSPRRRHYPAPLPRYIRRPRRGMPSYRQVRHLDIDRLLQVNDAATLKTTMRGPADSQPSRNVPGPLSARLVTTKPCRHGLRTNTCHRLPHREMPALRLRQVLRLGCPRNERLAFLCPFGRMCGAQLETTCCRIDSTPSSRALMAASAVGQLSRANRSAPRVKRLLSREFYFS